MSYTKEKAQILGIYELANGNSEEAARLLSKNMPFPPTSGTIRNYWKNEGYKINPRGGKRIALNGGRGAFRPEEEKAIIEAYHAFGSAYKAARNLPYSYTAISNVLIRNKLKTGIRKRKDISLEKRLQT